VRVEDVSMQIWRILDGGEVSADSKWVLTDITLAVQQAAARLIQKDAYDDYNRFGEWNINTNYIEYFEENPVLYNEVTGNYYIKMPTDLLTLGLDYSLQFCGRSMNLNDAFTRTTLGTTGFFNLPKDIISYFVTADTIQFVRFDPLIKNVMLGLISALPQQINADDVPEIKDLVIKQFMPAVLQIPEDKTNNSAPVNSQ
jgi:hypothetical protein